MNDDQLNRLLRAASRAEVPSDQSIPFGFETRVLAHWKRNPEELSLALFRRALACACAIAVTSFALSYRTLNSSPSTELSIANNAMEINFTP